MEDIRYCISVIQAYINHRTGVTPDISVQSVLSNPGLAITMYQTALNFFQTDTRGHIAWLR